MGNTITLHRVLKAPRERVFRAFTDPVAQAKWLPPDGFTCTVEKLDAREGGTFRMAFHNFANGQSHSFGGTYLEVVPNARLRYTDAFDNPALSEIIVTTVVLREVSCGTDVIITQENVPAAIPPEMCYLGWQDSLRQLAHLVEAAPPAE